MGSVIKKPIGCIANWWRSTADADVILKDYRSVNDLECSVQGFVSTPSTETTFDIYESFSITSQHLYYDLIKLTLEELSRCKSSQFTIPDEIEWFRIVPENVQEVFKDASELDINVGFLWAALLKRPDLFPAFLELGAQTSFYEHTYGLSALHLVAYSGCKTGAQYLLSQQGCYINLMCKCYSPLHCAAFGNSPEVAALLLDKGANIDGFTNDLHCNLEGVLHCAVRANAIACLQLFCDKGANINQLDSSGRTPIQLAADLGHAECLRVLVEANGGNINQQTKEKQQTAMHFAAHKGHVGCLNVLIDHAAAINIQDYRQQTPLHLAAKSHNSDCVKTLLKKGKANPNLQDIQLRTALHLTVEQTNGENFTDIIRTLISYGADVNAKDSRGFTPLHLAARNELAESVDTLISCNADITAKTNKGVTALGMIYQKTPSGIKALKKKLDDSVSFIHQDSSGKGFELQIDFSVILRYCHPNEILFLSTLLDEGQKELLLHPVCMAFLYLKWKKIRRFFVFKAVCCFLLMISMSGYVLMGLAKHCYNFGQNITTTTYELDKELCINRSFTGYIISKHPYIIEIQWYLMLIFASGIAIRKFYGAMGYSSILQYICSCENILDWATVMCVFLISFVYTGRTYIWQNHVSAFAVLIGWTNFMHILGQFPFFGVYVAMYSSVQAEFGKLLLVFSCLLLGFTVSFCVLFPKSQVFSDISIGFISVLVMAVGEMNLELLSEPDPEEKAFMLKGSSEIIYIIYVSCVSIILLNLLVGIAVNDIQGLKNTAKLAKVCKETKLIYYMEKALTTDYFHRKILTSIFRWKTLVSSKGYCVLNMKIQNNTDAILPEDILQSAVEIAEKQRKKKKKKSDFNKSSLKNQFPTIENDLNDLRNDVRDLNNEMLCIKNALEDNHKLMVQILQSISQ